MSKIRCVCGEVITLSGDIPNPAEWLYMSDTDYHAYSGLVDSEELYLKFGRAFVCPASGHIWVFSDGMDEDPVGYAPI